MLDATSTTTPLEDYLTFTDSPCAIRLKGHDIGLEQIVKRYRLGFSAEQVWRDFPAMSLEQIYGAITYYLHHKAEVDAYVADAEKRAPIVISTAISPAEKITAVIREHAHEWEVA